MHEFDDAITNLPGAYRADPWVAALLRSITGKDESLRADAWENAAQMFLDSLTFHLPTEEKLVGILPKATSTVEERKNILSAKWRSSTGKCDLEMIRGICGAWYEVDVEYDGNALDIRFISIIGVPPALDALLAVVQEVCPAHIPIGYTIRYRRWREVKPMLWGDLIEDTWAAVKGGELKNGRDFEI